MGPHLLALHGFLGLPSDWDPFSLPLSPVNLFDTPLVPMPTWAHTFNQTVAPHSVLLGYSLGGRLALHALLDNPSLYRGAILVSMSPGIASREERQQRLINDHYLSERFLHEPWEELMAFWNGQKIFRETALLPRKEADFSRHHLAQSLRVWSTGNQEHLLPALEALPIPILWLVGAKDPKAYLSLALKHPQSDVVVLDGAGHRLPWDVPALFVHHVRAFVERLFKKY